MRRPTIKEFQKEWISNNGIWKVVATVRENPALPGETHAFRDVQIYRYGAINYQEYSDDGRTPKIVMNKYREFMNLIYERSEST